jgi:hypothetical protein
MDIGIYRRLLEDYAKEAIQNSDGTNASIAEYLATLRPPGRFTSHREEKSLALADLRKAFDEHRHWPLAIILSHLGIENKNLAAS